MVSQSRYLRAPIVVGAVIAAVMAIGPGAARAADPICPEAVVKIVVPFPPGGPTDTTARLLAERLRDKLGQNVIVESKPGGSATVGTGYVAQQPGNGCTLLLAYDNHAVNPALFPNLPFDTATAFRPVTLIGTMPNVLAAHPSQSYKTFADVIAAAKAAPDGLVYGTGGAGTVAHMSLMVMTQPHGVTLRHVPYKGAAPAVQDFLGGHVPLMMGSVLSLAPSIRDGRARGIVQTGAKRHPLLPETATIVELGHPDLNIVSWLGVFLPASAPEALANRLHGEIATVLQEPFVRERMAALGIEIVGAPPAELGAFVAKEVARWKTVAAKFNIKGE